MAQTLILLSTQRSSAHNVSREMLTQIVGTGSYQAAHAQVLLDDDVVDGRHDEADLHRVRRAREMRVDLLRRVLVEPTFS